MTQLYGEREIKLVCPVLVEVTPNYSKITL